MCYDLTYCVLCIVTSCIAPVLPSQSIAQKCLRRHELILQFNFHRDAINIDSPFTPIPFILMLKSLCTEFLNSLYV